MTGTQLAPAGLPTSAAAPSPRQAGASVHTRPIVVLTYPYAGVGELHSLLSRCPGIACTSGTGMLPLSQQAMLTWQQAEDGRPPSRLALTSIRALTTTVITTMLARTGKQRWCEIATAPPAYAETFLDIYPGTRFLCLHRDCTEVIRAAARANPWGLSGPEFSPFTAAYPGHSAVALAAYWAAHTEPMLAFEAAHPEFCLRVKHEDIARNPDRHGKDILAFLGLSPAEAAAAQLASDHSAEARCDLTPTAAVPTSQIPESLATQVNALLTQLAYPNLARGAS